MWFDVKCVTGAARRSSLCVSAPSSTRVVVGGSSRSAEMRHSRDYIGWPLTLVNDNKAVGSRKRVPGNKQASSVCM